jgi:L-serine dehydratase
MNIFDIVGPIMIGPSSSHTAGVVRIGNMVQKIIGYTPTDIVIKFHGSFATTYMGHGSDKAIIAGLMGYETDALEIRTSHQIAKDRGIKFSFEPIYLKNAHPNTIIIECTLKDNEKITVVAESVGGANIIIRKINDFDLELNGNYHTLVITHKDNVGILSKITKALYEHNVNIAQMSLYREKKGGNAMTVIEADDILDISIVPQIEAIDDVLSTKYVPGLS